MLAIAAKSLRSQSVTPECAILLCLHASQGVIQDGSESAPDVLQLLYEKRDELLDKPMFSRFCRDRSRPTLEEIAEGINQLKSTENNLEELVRCGRRGLKKSVVFAMRSMMYLEPNNPEIQAWLAVDDRQQTLEDANAYIYNQLLESFLQRRLDEPSALFYAAAEIHRRALMLDSFEFAPYLWLAINKNTCVAQELKTSFPNVFLTFKLLLRLSGYNSGPLGSYYVTDQEGKRVMQYMDEARNIVTEYLD